MRDPRKITVLGYCPQCVWVVKYMPGKLMNNVKKQIKAMGESDSRGKHIWSSGEGQAK